LRLNIGALIVKSFVFNVRRSIACVCAAVVESVIIIHTGRNAYKIAFFVELGYQGGFTR